jgi:iron complex outermembrane recepter protein
VRRVNGASTAAEALGQMLSGSGYRAIAAGPSSFRIVKVSGREMRTAPLVTSPANAGTVEPEIVVTALKRRQSLSSLPATIHVAQGGRLLSSDGVAGSDDIAREVTSLSMSSLGPGRNRLFLRGIGDGPLNGFNEGSVAILLDEARLNYDAPDPDWALIDVDQVEVLEGPQGPLYGTGALGGIVKISTIRPNLSRFSASAKGSFSVTEDGDFSNAQSVSLNIPILAGDVAVRGVGYRQLQAGWIDNVGGNPDSNRERLVGGRLSVRWSPSKDWTVDLTGAVQDRAARDSQYVDGNAGTLRRPNRLPEYRDLNAKLAVLTINGPIGSVGFTSVTSLSRQEAEALYDASPLARVLGTTGSTLARDDRHYRLFDQELRIESPHDGKLDWLGGVSLIAAKTHASIIAQDSSKAIELLKLDRSITEGALFGEASYTLSPSVSVGAGARIFSTAVDDEGVQGGSQRMRGLRDLRASGDATFAWKSPSDATIFLRVATAYRPGGINAERDASQTAYEADELVSGELGSRLQVSRALFVAATLYAERWQRVQSDELLTNGLVATRNAGNARNIGIEANVQVKLGSRFAITGGLLAQSARLDTSDRVSGIDDPRLPAVPQAAARLKFEGGFRLGEWDGRASLGFRYSGATHVSFDPLLDRRTPRRGMIDGALELSRDGWTAALVGDNLTNNAADTFAFGNPFRVRLQPQRTPARPRTIGLSLSRTF